MTNLPIPYHASGNERAYCCQINCKSDAVWRLHWKPYHYENTADACDDHLGEMVTWSEATEFHILPVAALNPSARSPQSTRTGT